MESIRESYEAYLKQAESLPREMRRRGIQFVSPRFIETYFVVYADGTAEVPIRNQPLLSRMRLRERVTKRVGLESVGELLHHLTSTEDRYQYVPKNLDQIAPADIKGLSSALCSAEDACCLVDDARVRKSEAPIKSL